MAPGTFSATLPPSPFAMPVSTWKSPSRPSRPSRACMASLSPPCAAMNSPKAISAASGSRGVEGERCVPLGVPATSRSLRFASLRRCAASASASASGSHQVSLRSSCKACTASSSLPWASMNSRKAASAAAASVPSSASGSAGMAAAAWKPAVARWRRHGEPSASASPGPAPAPPPAAATAWFARKRSTGTAPPSRACRAASSASSSFCKADTAKSTVPARARKAAAGARAEPSPSSSSRGSARRPPRTAGVAGRSSESSKGASASGASACSSATMAKGGAATPQKPPANPAQQPVAPVAGAVPKKHQRAVELARKDLTLKRWEYFVDPIPPFLRPAVKACLVDERDYPMAVLLTNLMVVVAAAAWQYTLEPGSTFAHRVGLVYLVSTAILFDARFILCLHYSAHLKLFSPAKLGAVAAGLLNEVLPTCLAPLFGIPSGMYFLHHVAMHHVEDNLFPLDLTSTLPYQRDRFLDFLKYWATYVIGSLVYLPLYALYKGRGRLAVYAVCLMAAWVAAIRCAWLCNPTAALWTLMVPFAKSSFTLMFGNFSQHIFVDPARPADDYVATYNCLNVFDNRFTFNDGYHIVHHLNARKHWSEMPQSFIDNVAKYEEHGALCFEGLFFFEVGIFVMLGQWRRLARHVVQLRDDPLTEDQLVNLLKRRVQAIPHKWD
mmetsp:Transcript_18059/g.52683  ORF Transcript_18059/g.52683 Transcript_18059/m.52683 type:complete len:669 (+) Transcript_18059:621-2627(+)